MRTVRLLTVIPRQARPGSSPATPRLSQERPELGPADLQLSSIWRPGRRSSGRTLPGRRKLSAKCWGATSPHCQLQADRSELWMWECPDTVTQWHSDTFLNSVTTSISPWTTDLWSVSRKVEFDELVLGQFLTKTTFLPGLFLLCKEAAWKDDCISLRTKRTQNTPLVYGEKPVSEDHVIQASPGLAVLAAPHTVHLAALERLQQGLVVR